MKTCLKEMELITGKKLNYSNTFCHSPPGKLYFYIKIMTVVILPKFKHIMIEYYLFVTKI